jgi:Flp pilus assembly protein TadG
VSPSRSERGSALVEVSWLAILLLVPLLYVVLAVFDVQRSAFAVSAAARAAGRAYTIAPSQAEGMDRAWTAAAIALDDQGLDMAHASLVLSCTPDPHACLTPGSVVHVHVAYPVPLPLMPSALGGQTPSIRVETEPSLPYGTFRQARP